MNKIILVLSIATLLPFAAGAEGRSPEQIYNSSCSTCHSIGVANAPITHNEEAWKARQKTLEEFLASTKVGINAMPPMGTCMDCSDEELKATIEFMMKKAEVK